VEKLVIVDISPVAVSSTLSIMPKYFEGMMSVKLDRNIPLSKARRMADEQLAKYVLVCVKKCCMCLVMITVFWDVWHSVAWYKFVIVLEEPAAATSILT
jgi:hypothetical protein